MSGIVGGINLRSSGLVNNSSATDGQVFTGTGAGLPAGFEAAGGGGKVLQVVQDVLTSKWSVASTSFTAVSGLSVAITPASGTKILVLGHLSGAVGAATNGGGTAVKRDSTFIHIGDDANSRFRGVGNSYRVNHDNQTHQSTIHYLDTHGADGSTEVVYTWQVFSEASSTFYVNSDVDATGAYSYYGNFASSIIAVEIGS